MQMSQTIVNLSKALLKAQASMGGAVKGAKNPFFKSNYSDYNSVLEVVKEPLNSAGIVVLQPTVVRDGKTLIQTTLLHSETGEYLTSEMEVVCAKQNDPQAYGSAVTYSRRYSLQSLLSIPSVDSDAEDAMDRGKQMTSVSKSPKQEAPVGAPTDAPAASTEPVKTSSWRKPKTGKPVVEVPATDGMDF